jgi:DNA-directed RNA polymerase sigma subunit (sigma70/sigma32)
MTSSRTRTSERTRTQVEVETLQRALRTASLEPLEERVLRMRLGVGEAAHASLRFDGQSQEQSRVKLAQFEHELLSDFRQAALPPEVENSKERILAKLRRLGDTI